MSNIPVNPSRVQEKRAVNRAAPRPTSFLSKDGFDLMAGHQPKPDIIPSTLTPRPLIPKTGLRLGLSGRGH